MQEMKMIVSLEKEYPGLHFLRGQLGDQKVDVLVTAQDKLLVWESGQLLYVMAEKNDSKNNENLQVDCQKKIQLNEKVNEIHENIGPLEEPFLEIEPKLIQQYGKGCWVVYSEVGLSICPTAKIADEMACQIPGGKLVCCLGYRMLHLCVKYEYCQDLEFVI